MKIEERWQKEKMKLTNIKKHGNRHDEKSHGNWATGAKTLKLDRAKWSRSKVKPSLTDEEKKSLSEKAEDIFDVSIPGYFSDGYVVTGGNIRITRGGAIRVAGSIVSNEGEEIGWFERDLMPDGSVYMADFSIEDEYQGQGIGSAFLHEWEHSLAAAGFDEMTVTATDVGRYAWAKAGYDWDTEFELPRMRKSAIKVLKEDSWRTDGRNDIPEARALAKQFSTSERWITPAELALSPGGKTLLLTMTAWGGKKSLVPAREVRKADNMAYLQFLQQWFAKGRFKEYEQETDQFLNEARAVVGAKVSKDFIAKHPGPDGGEIHATGTTQEVHGRGRLKALRGFRSKDKKKVEAIVGGDRSVMGMDGLPDSVKAKILDDLKNRYTHSLTPEEVTANYEKVLAYAEKLYKENPELRDEQRFYERWFDTLDEVHSMHGSEDMTLEQLAGLGAVISPGLEAETNLWYAREMTRIFGENHVVPDWMVPMINWTMDDKRDGYLADKYPDDYYDADKAGQSKRPDTHRAAAWDYQLEQGMRIQEIPNKYAAIMVVRDIYNRANEGGEYEKFFAPKGWDNFAKGWDILKGDETTNDILKGPKVRSFYNNILDPTDVGGFGDVTIDFQMIEAGMNGRRGGVLPTSISSTPSRYSVGLGVRPVLADSVRELLPEWGDRVGAESPAQLQEVIWATWKRGKETDEWGELFEIREK